MRVDSRIKKVGCTDFECRSMLSLSKIPSQMSSPSFQIVGIEGLARFQNAVDQMQQFAHDSTNDDHRVFAALTQVLSELPNDGIVSHGDHRRHVEGFAHARMADLGETWFAAPTRSRFMLARR